MSNEIISAFVIVSTGITAGDIGAAVFERR